MHMDSLRRRQSALFMHCSWDPQPLYSKKKIKNRFHGTIHTFKNYFATVFLVFNKINCIQTDPDIQELQNGQIREISSI